MRIELGHPIILVIPPGEKIADPLIHLPTRERTVGCGGPRGSAHRIDTLAGRCSTTRFWPDDWTTLCGQVGLVFQYDGTTRARRARRVCPDCLAAAPLDADGILDVGWELSRHAVNRRLELVA